MQEGNRTCQLMGTIIQLWIQHDRPDPVLNEAEKRLIDYEKRFSANDSDSCLMKINHNAGIAPVHVEEDLFELIKIGRTHSLPADSFLNITIGPLIKEWRIGFNDANHPSDSRIKEILNAIDANQIILDEQKKTIFLKDKGMAIDLGALAKGYFADNLLDYFKDEGVKAALIDLGGNVLTYGDAPKHEDTYWRVGIQHPFLPRGHFAAAVKVKNQSVVTSGIYERTNKIDGKTYHHIFDSRTGYPIDTDIVSLTVISEKSLDGEIWTTRLFGQKPEQIIAELNTLDQTSGIIITKEGKLCYSKALSSQLIIV